MRKDGIHAEITRSTSRMNIPLIECTWYVLSHHAYSYTDGHFLTALEMVGHSSTRWKMNQHPLWMIKKVVDVLSEPNKTMKVVFDLWREKRHIWHYHPSFFCSTFLKSYSSWGRNQTSYLVVTIGLHLWWEPWMRIIWYVLHSFTCGWSLICHGRYPEHLWHLLHGW